MITKRMKGKIQNYLVFTCIFPIQDCGFLFKEDKAEAVKFVPISSTIS